MEVLSLLENELDECMETINKLDPTTDDYTVAAKNYVLLHDAHMKEKEIGLEYHKADLNYKVETARIKVEAEEAKDKIEDLKKERKGNYIKTGLYIASTVGIVILSFAGSRSGIMDSKLVKNTEKLLNLVLRA